MKHRVTIATLFIVCLLAAPIAFAQTAPCADKAVFMPIPEEQVILASFEPTPQGAAWLLSERPTEPSFLSNQCTYGCYAQADRCVDECVFTPSCGSAGLQACDDALTACLASC